MKKLTFKDGSNTQTVLLSDLLEQRIEYQTITDDAPLLAFTIADGVINPEEKKSNKRDFLMKDKVNKRFELTEKDDIIYNPANVVFGAIHRNSLGRGVVSPIYKIFKCVHVDSSYMDCVVTRASFIQELSKYAEGSVTKLRTLAPESFLNLEITLPTDITEQHKIGELIESLQAKIVSEKTYVEKLKTLKMSMLTKMFPKDGERVPEIRFKGFTDNWKQRKWNETVDISTDMVDPRNEIYNELPHVAPGNIESFTGQLYDNVKLVKEENLISGKFRFHTGDIIYGKINPQLGKYVFTRFDGLTSADAYVLNAKNDLHQKFLFALLQTKDFYEYSVSVSKRSGMPKINRNELNAYNFLAPSFEEQRKIGELFLNIDNLITLHQRKYEKLIDTKKAMLEKLIGGAN